MEVREFSPFSLAKGQITDNQVVNVIQRQICEILSNIVFSAPTCQQGRNRSCQKSKATGYFN